MAKIGYGSVAPRAFLDFGPRLEEGAWGTIEGVSGADGLGAPTAGFWKHLLKSSLEHLAQAQARPGDPERSELDEAWDSLQWQMEAFLTFHAIGKDKAKSQAARRLREVLLQGALGRGPAQDTYQDAVEFGRRQARLSNEGTETAEDVATLEMAPLLEEATAATEKLASTLAEDPDAPAARHKRWKVALAECREAFSWVHEGLELLLGREAASAASAPERRAELEALLAPLDALVEAPEAD